MFSKKLVFTITILLFIVQLATAQSNTIYGLIKKINTEPDEVFKPTIVTTNGAMEGIFEGVRVDNGTTIITYDRQSVDITIFINDKAAFCLKISENTDISFNYSVQTRTTTFTSKFGRFRLISAGESQFIIDLKETTITGNSCDFSIVFLIDANGRRYGSLYNLGAPVNIRTELRNRTINRMNKTDFNNADILQPSSITEEIFNGLKQDQVFLSFEANNRLEYVLEKYQFNRNVVVLEPEIEEVIVEEVPDLTADIVVDNSTDTRITDARLAGAFFLSFLSMEIGSTTFDNQIAIKIISRPGLSLFNNLFEFGFYFPIFLVPSKMFTSESPIANTNINNNEWSFGSDQGNNTSAIVMDVFNDIFLKLRVIRWRDQSYPVSLYIGEINNLNDLTKFSMNDYNSKIFYPTYRQVSFITRFNLDWFRCFIYAENLLPQGLYGIDLSFNTPSKVFRFEFNFSVFMDAYTLIQTDPVESVFPTRINAGISMEPFDLTSFGLKLFLNTGILLPFSANMYTGESEFVDTITSNPLSILSGMAGNVGFLARIKSFSIGAEFIFDSGVNKVGLFDISYIALRESRAGTVTDWLSDMSSREVSINDFNFGFRLNISYNWVNFIYFDIKYKVTFPQYYDQLYLKLSIDSTNRYKFNFDIFIQWQVESLVTSFQSTKQFQLHNVGFIGFGLHPHKSISIRGAFGIYPDTVTASDPWYSKFTVDFSIIVRPEVFLLESNNQDGVSDLL